MLQIIKHSIVQRAKKYLKNAFYVVDRILLIINVVPYIENFKKEDNQLIKKLILKIILQLHNFLINV